MGKVESFEDLRCWQAARRLTNDVYRLCSEAPLSKEYRLRNQLTSASVSAMTNIAEGFTRYHRGDFVRFLDISQSSTAEVRSLLYVVLDQGFASEERIASLQKQCEKTRALTLGLLRYVQRQRDTDSARSVQEPSPSYDSPSDEPPYSLPNAFSSLPDEHLTPR